ncbi:hypothetical protein [Peribacillus muralis]|uniref:hypothetical protein n=1 Tax=Peribacillus muralis TaxID=264697 RepID=UPI003D020D43
MYPNEKIHALSGVAPTDPALQKALVIDEKKYHVTIREGLSRISTAAGLDSPIHFRPEHICYMVKIF